MHSNSSEARATRSYGSGDGLANLFFKFYGGLIFTSSRALWMLNAARANFDPFSVMDLESLPSCTKDPEAKSPASYNNKAVSRSS